MDNTNFGFQSQLPWDYPGQASGSTHATGFGGPSEGHHVISSGHVPDRSSLLLGVDPTSTVPRPRRSKYTNLDWDGNKDNIKKYYLEENNDLKTTMDLMKIHHSFEASPKLYKDKFKLWEWRKNLPASQAQFMLNKATKRRREGKDTVFTSGGQSWTQERVQSSAMRVKKARTDEGPQDMNTPEGVSYKTPKTIVHTPDDVIMVESGESADSFEYSDSVEDSDFDDEALQSGPVTRQTPSIGPELRLRWNGHTRSSLLELRDFGQSLIQQGNAIDAEAALIEAREGLGHILGFVNEDTIKVGYSLAELLAEADRTPEVDEIMEDITQKHIEILGHEDKRTKQHVLYVAEFLNTWNRSADALAFLSRSYELLQALERDDEQPRARQSRKGRSAHSGGKGKSTQRFDREPRRTFLEITEAMLTESDSAGIDNALQVARSHSLTKDNGAEAILLRITQHCEKKPQEFPIQTLKARGQLLQLYVDLGTVERNSASFENSRGVLSTVMNLYQWDEEKFQCIEVMEAALQLAANTLKGGFERLAKDMFRVVEQQAERLFTYNDERTIWILITIGLVYQSRSGWNTAKDWFDQAFTGALANPDWNEKDGVVKSLQNAREKKHFSWLSDEGRPFKTIFGVSGITIRPGRLHLD